MSTLCSYTWQCVLCVLHSCWCTTVFNCCLFPPSPRPPSPLGLRADRAALFILCPHILAVFSHKKIRLQLKWRGFFIILWLVSLPGCDHTVGNTSGCPYNGFLVMLAADLESQWERAAFLLCAGGRLGYHVTGIPCVCSECPFCTSGTLQGLRKISCFALAFEK